MKIFKRCILLLLVFILTGHIQGCGKIGKQVLIPIATYTFDNLITNCIPFGSDLIVSTEKGLFMFTSSKEVEYKKEDLLKSKGLNLVKPIVVGVYNGQILLLYQEENYYRLLRLTLTKERTIAEVSKDENFKVPCTTAGAFLGVNFSDDYLYWIDASIRATKLPKEPSNLIYSINIYNVKDGSSKKLNINESFPLKLTEFNGIVYSYSTEPANQLIAINIESGDILWKFELDPSKEDLTLIKGSDFEVYDNEIYLIYRALPRVSASIDLNEIFGVKIIDRLSGIEKTKLIYYTKFGFGKNAPYSGLFWDKENFFAEIYGYGILSAISKDTNKVRWTTTIGSPLLDLLPLMSKKKVIALSENGTVNVIDTQSGKILKNYNLFPNPKGVVLIEGLLNNKGKIIHLTDNNLSIYLNFELYRDGKFEQASKLFFVNIK